jgi:hypothetical protein
MALPRKTRRARQSFGAEYRFKIDAYTPNTIPMARLSQYMAELAHMWASHQRGTSVGWNREALL